MLYTNLAICSWYRQCPKVCNDAWQRSDLSDWISLCRKRNRTHLNDVETFTTKQRLLTHNDNNILTLTYMYNFKACKTVQLYATDVYIFQEIWVVCHNDLYQLISSSKLSPLWCKSFCLHILIWDNQLKAIINSKAAIIFKGPFSLLEIKGLTHL